MAGGLLRVRRDRRAENRNFRLRKPTWVDPFPFIPGTEPEKRLFEALVNRHIFFLFQADLPELEHKNVVKRNQEIKRLEAEIRRLIRELVNLNKKDAKLERVIRQKLDLDKKLRKRKAELDYWQQLSQGGAFLFEPGFKPDFVMPEYKVILDPFGIFHHSLPDAVKRDTIKSAVYRALGYAFYHPWWDERGFLWADGTGSALHFERIGYDANAVLDRIPEFKLGEKYPLKDPVQIEAKKKPGYILGRNLGAGANSVAIANHMRTKPKVLTIKRRKR